MQHVTARLTDKDIACHFTPKMKLSAVLVNTFFFLFKEHLNETIVILALVYLGGALAALLRAWLFTLSGQRLVARIRKQASSCGLQLLWLVLLSDVLSWARHTYIYV